LRISVKCDRHSASIGPEKEFWWIWQPAGDSKPHNQLIEHRSIRMINTDVNTFKVFAMFPISSKNIIVYQAIKEYIDENTELFEEF
jgi:hypothetical protein